MTAPTDQILQKLFSRQSLEEMSVDELRDVLNKYPYFTLAHFLLSKKLQLSNSPEFLAESERTSLYVQEPIWLQSLLYDGEFAQTKNPEQLPVLPTEGGNRENGTNESSAEPGTAEKPIEESIAPNDDNKELQSILPESRHEEVEVPEEPQPSPPLQEISKTDTDQATSQAEVDEEKIQVQAFEPYHTIDYFASQGIRISADYKPTDRLGQQLKSFTEWLKTLKRLPEAQVEAQLDDLSQQRIQAIANHSLDEKEVVTETMAEVLIKQDKPEEAVRIYEKLSLTNPSKRAYFAAKIEQIKSS